ncbi:MAG TPA: helix-turn-helix transcriptional regulator [Ktedonobacteraceae bacterium]|nr:helix-turn-helix transcriptional regulator [Ktedonobacteraceae bacterium]
MRTLTENGKTFVLVPLIDFERMTRNSEDIGDIAAFDAAMERDEEAFPITLLDAIDTGENPIKAFRKYRGMKQAELANMTCISPAYLSQLENGTREGSVKMVKAIAVALNVPMDLLA